MNGPHWIKQWIADLAMLNDQFRNDDGSVDFDALGREEYMFRMALITRNFSKSERALVVFEKAQASYETNVERGKKGGRPRKETTADGDTREDSLAKPDGSAITRNETRAHDALEPSANHYGDAPRREAGEAVHSRESGSIAPTTVSRNMRRVPQNEAPAHGFSGGRTAQGTMSRSPEAAAQSGKDYDQEPYRESTDEPQPEGLTGPSHGGSVASLEARQGQALESQRRAGADSVRGTPLHSAPARPRAKNSRCPNSREDFHAFVADNNLHEGLAEEWYSMHEARGWVDENGNPIKNWRGALYNYCTKTEQKRRTA